MAILENSLTRERVFLRISHIFGRAGSSANTVIKGDKASRLHASVSWQGDHWQLEDISTNGTYVNGEKLPHHGKKRLASLDKIHFGELGAECWLLTDDSEPKPMLVSVERGESHELQGITVLPDEHDPQITLYPSAGMRWLCECNEQTRELYTGDLVQADGQAWYFVDNYPLEQTHFINSKEQQAAAEARACFTVSRNEEHISLIVSVGEWGFDLGRKASHYLLLLLARKRQQDLQQGLPEADAGWLDKAILCKELRTEEQYMNIQIYRYRKQLEKAVPQHLYFPQTLERRLREVRVNFGQIEISGGNMFNHQ